VSYDVRPAREGELEAAVAIDDSASLLYAEWGIRLALTAEHPFCQAERQRWTDAIREERLFFAFDPAPPFVALGFASCDRVDDAPYLDQLAVRADAMRRGIGSLLLAHAITWATRQCSGERFLWLTTYAHLPFNRGFYERAGFAVVPEASCSLGIRHHLEEQRRHLPESEQRVAMRRPL
jgi:GNAT superfamily N-acetyltransferase